MDRMSRFQNRVATGGSMNTINGLRTWIALFCLVMLVRPAWAGSLGNDIDYAQALGSALEARVAADLLDHDHWDTPQRGFDSLGLRLRGLSALLDWQPVRNGFHFSGGLLYNPGLANRSNQPVQGLFTSAGRIYATDVMAGLSAGAELHRFSPYLGIGWRRATDRSRRFALGFDLGVIYQESPSPGFDSANPADNPVGFGAGLWRPSLNLQNNLGGLHLYPVMSLGMGYRF